MRSLPSSTAPADPAKSARDCAEQQGAGALPPSLRTLRIYDACAFPALESKLLNARFGYDHAGDLFLTEAVHDVRTRVLEIATLRRGHLA